MATPWYFVADIGGSNARFAAFRDGVQVDQTAFKTGVGGDFLAQAKAFSARQFSPPQIAVFAVAGPVRNNAVTLTNTGQALTGAEIALATGTDEAHIINDFTAAAWSTLAVSEADLQPISGAPTPGPGNRVVIGPGTGLGVGALLENSGRFTSLQSEGGHIGIGPRQHSEIAVFEALKTLWPEVFFGDGLVMEAEGILSGLGIPMLYQAVQISKRHPPESLTTAEVFARAKEGRDDCAILAIEMFKTHLGQLAGDLGLVFNATGGLFLLGGVAQSNPWLFDAGFREALSMGGRFTGARRELSVYLIKRPDFGLLGAHQYIVSALLKQ